MAEEKANKEGGESKFMNEHTSPPSSPRRPPSPNPRKRKNPKDLVPSLYNCHSCGRHYPPRSQTLTDLRTLDSEWRIVLLCDQCLRSIRSASKCSYCFSDFSDAGKVRFLDCRQCSARIHIDCVPSQQRFISLASLDPDSFVCVDCCALPRIGNRNPTSLFSSVSLEELVREAKKKAAAASRAKEKALEKVVAAKCAAERAKGALDVVNVAEVDPVVKDEELALQLHLAMNGSQRFSRSGRYTNSNQSVGVKKSRKVAFCTEDKGFLDSWRASVVLNSSEKNERRKEINGCSSSSSSRSLEVVAKEEQGSWSDKVANSSEDNIAIPQLIMYRRRKLKGVGSRESSSESKLELNCTCVEEKSSESEQKSSSDQLDRYAKKYCKRKSSLKQVMNTECQLVLQWQTSCSQASTLSDAPFSNMSGCQS